VHDLNEVFVFVTVVDQKGFSSASRALKLPKSSVSPYNSARRRGVFADVRLRRIKLCKYPLCIVRKT
jgi:hypothetical protein